MMWECDGSGEGKAYPKCHRCDGNGTLESPGGFWAVYSLVQIEEPEDDDPDDGDDSERAILRSVAQAFGYTVTPGEPIPGVSITDLDLSSFAGALKRLEREGFETVDQLLQYSRNDLLRLDSIGRRTLRAIEEGLAAVGLALAEEEPEECGLSDEVRRAVNWLDRADIVRHLESAGIACYDSEDTDTLREALLVNLEDGTIDPEVL